MAELILVIKLFLIFVAILIVCGIVLLLAVIISAIKYFIKNREGGNNDE